MSQIEAYVTSLKQHDEVYIVTFQHEEHVLMMTSLGLKDLKKDCKVILNIKSSHVGIAKNPTGELSFSNKILAKIIDINIGKILCVAKLEISKDKYIESILTAQSAQKMDLKIGDEVFAIFQASELSIVKILS